MNGARSPALLPAALLLALAGCSVPVKVPEIPILEQPRFCPSAHRGRAGRAAALNRRDPRCRCRSPDS